MVHFCLQRQPLQHGSGRPDTAFGDWSDCDQHLGAVHQNTTPVGYHFQNVHQQRWWFLDFCSFLFRFFCILAAVTVNNLKLKRMARKIAWLVSNILLCDFFKVFFLFFGTN